VKTAIEIAGRLRFDWLIIALLGIYVGIFAVAGKIQQLGYGWLFLWGLLGVFKLFSRVETVSDFQAWMKANLRRSWRIFAVYGVILAFTLSYVIEGKFDPWTGFSGIAFSTAGALACMGWHCRSSKRTGAE
jgi:hypothetical protein